ncbi:hypothetical protein U1737_05775 [Sphingomonas sp. LB3N6]|uniref:hypothetical protein n=1 Tax=Sphingomonas fucosidasi TaxID=3096164 RepID=UPI002FCBE08C
MLLNRHGRGHDGQHDHHERRARAKHAQLPMASNRTAHDQPVLDDVEQNPRQEDRYMQMNLCRQF